MMVTRHVVQDLKPGKNNCVNPQQCMLHYIYN